MIYKNKSLSF